MRTVPSLPLVRLVAVVLLTTLGAGCGGGGGGGGGGDDDGGTFEPPTGTGSAPGPTLPAPILVQEALPPGASGVARSGGVATFGLPFRQGDVGTQGGRPALSVQGATRWQARTLRTWPDGSVAWALLDVMTDVAAGAVKGGLSVESGTGKSGQANIASENASLVVLQTGPMYAEISKPAFNLLHRVVVDGTELVAGGTSAGVVGKATDGVFLLPTALTTVVIEENGPVRAVVRADGTLARPDLTEVLDFTCRITARAGSRDLEVSFTVRNADLDRPQHTTVEFVELLLRTAPGANPTATLARHDGQHVSVLTGGETARLYQAYSNADTSVVLGQTPNYLPHIPKLDDDTLAQEGYEIVVKGITTIGLGNKTIHPPHGYVDLTGPSGGVTVAMRQMPYMWPAAIEVAADGFVSAGVFTGRNIAPYTFIWRQHESRTVLFSFHKGTTADPLPVAKALDWPLTGRAADYKHYDHAGVLPYRLVTLAEQNEVYAELGLAHAVTIHNDPLQVTRFLYKGSPGASNNHDRIEKWLGGEWLRHGHGGQYLNALDLALYKSEWQVARSDGWNHALDPGPVNDGVPHTENVQADLEHRYRDGMILAYYLTGDERMRGALLDEAEILPTLSVSAQERGMYQSIRALARVAEFTGDPGGQLEAALRQRILYQCVPLLNIGTQSTGFGWQNVPDAGNRRYFVNSTQLPGEKPPGENFQARGFFSGSLGPLAFFHGARVLRAQSPADPEGVLARGRMRDLAFWTRKELYPYVPSPASRHWVYSLAVTLQQVTQYATSDFHPILLGMGEAWLDTGDPVYMQRGIQQIEAFAAHDQSSKYPNNLYEMESRLDAQHFFALCRVYLGLE